MPSPTVELFGLMLNPSQTAIVLVLGVLLFGRRLPEVGRSLGKCLREFRKGLVGIEEDIWASGTERSPVPLVDDI
jgi:sec-independent protein translocase protein TatA